MRPAWSRLASSSAGSHENGSCLRITCLSGHLPREPRPGLRRLRTVSSCNAAPGADITYSGMDSGGAHVLDQGAQRR
jgi:hypothetical protein